jgi:predicted SnoaL-like aldol condensation-catalyzing enzyme
VGTEADDCGDIFRVSSSKIAEHWDVMQEEVPAAQSANGNSMFID